MKKFLLGLALLLCGAGIAHAQTFVPVVGGVATVDASQDKSFNVFVNANVSGVVIKNPQPGLSITIFFQESATGGFTVAFGGNISGACTVSTTANATTACPFQYNSNSNQWFVAGGSSRLSDQLENRKAGRGTHDPLRHVPGIESRRRWKRVDSATSYG